jgi:hypothetical protein
MESEDRIPVIFPEQAGVPFTVALPPDGADSVEQAIFMIPRAGNVTFALLGQPPRLLFHSSLK